MIAQSFIVAAIARILSDALSGLHAGVRIESGRNRPLGAGADRMVVVRKLSSVPTGDPMVGSGTDWQTQIRVECYARGTAVVGAQDRADDLLVAAHAALQMHPTLDGLAMAVSPPTLDWDDDDIDTTLSVALARYTVFHRTAINSLEAAT